MKIEEIRKTLFEEIKAFGGSLNKVAIHYKLPYSTLWNIVNRGDDYRPDDKTIHKIAAGLGVKPIYQSVYSISEDGEGWGVDEVDKKILKALQGMTLGEKGNILEYIEDQKLLKEVKRRMKEG